LLVLAEEENGEIYIYSSDQTGEFVKIRGKDFFDKDDPSFQQRYIDAIEGLIERRLIRRMSKNRITITGSVLIEHVRLKREKSQIKI